MIVAKPLRIKLKNYRKRHYTYYHSLTSETHPHLCLRNGESLKSVTSKTLFRTALNFIYYVGDGDLSNGLVRPLSVCIGNI